MDLCIKDGWVIDPAQKISSIQNVGIHNGKICCLSVGSLEAEKTIDAKGYVVVPGFIDIHMHEGGLHPETGELDTGIFETMLRMGVTTAIGGNCGEGPESLRGYLEHIDRRGIPVNLGMLVPHNTLRAAVGARDKYEKATDEQISAMAKLAKEKIEEGGFGISFGIRYIPGIDKRELLGIASVLANTGKVLAAHIRDDASKVVDSARELLNIGQSLGIPIQVSHIGSMGAYGQMEDLLTLVDNYRSLGVEVAMDCYPYNAFSTGIGETTYDEGFLQRYGTDYSSIEVAEGPYKGQRLTERLFQQIRREFPKTITIGHVMNGEEIERALGHPNVMIASDGFMHHGQGHPRASGTFPRVLGRYVREKRILSLENAIEKMTYFPARQFGIAGKGSLKEGYDADVVIFNPDAISDRATFECPCLPPEGIQSVFISGRLAMEGNVILEDRLGKSIRRINSTEEDDHHDSKRSA